MEEDYRVRTVECLRGRLLAERVASRKAKEEADQLETKLVELESLLKVETKSRNRVVKKLKFLQKKLQCNKISNVLPELELSILSDKSKEILKHNGSQSHEIPAGEEILSSSSEANSPENRKSPVVTKNFEQNSASSTISDQSRELELNQDFNDSKTDEEM
ncbi:unnamed protein product [Fraxinus pennsylvanica]|uniref:Uncharacterized protein n=1 Tax=Fraxinus pennsylvanica TaxID=56036 RepID=A0AAD2ABB9_9LAMI|nr:unnamed protein product [Fraxinus pennsylvanica]